MDEGQAIAEHYQKHSSSAMPPMDGRFAPADALHTSTSKVPVRERSCASGRIIAINAHRINLALLKQRLQGGGYHLHETQHFLLCLRAKEPTTLVVHWFAPVEMDANIGQYFMQELKPFGLLADPQSYGDLFAAVVCSLAPRDPQGALYLYAANTLRRYQHNLLVEQAQPVALANNAPIDVFSTLYRRVYELQRGETFLDAGCSFGFLPLLMAERFPSLRQVVGVDIQTASFAIVRRLAQEQGLTNVSFAQVDLLSDGVSELGSFDTVTLLHVLEHFTAEEMYRVLARLLPMVAQQLIIAVPYEREEPEAAYGHQQLFSRSRLEAMGAWCLQQWGDQGRMWYEDCADGLIVLER
ncbi:MAG TPA: class I SAM-dependent methyltransferase [Ktedonosporobacter sp.]|nr:class I SAM-dependent methyltransferase [Ktedonosporobacter sp.]